MHLLYENSDKSSSISVNKCDSCLTLLITNSDSDQCFPDLKPSHMHMGATWSEQPSWFFTWLDQSFKFVWLRLYTLQPSQSRKTGFVIWNILQYLIGGTRFWVPEGDGFNPPIIHWLYFSWVEVRTDNRNCLQAHTICTVYLQHSTILQSM